MAQNALYGSNVWCVRSIVSGVPGERTDSDFTLKSVKYDRPRKQGNT